MFIFVVFFLFVNEVKCQQDDRTLEAIWNLTSYAIQGRQRYFNPQASSGKYYPYPPQGVHGTISSGLNNEFQHNYPYQKPNLHQLPNQNNIGYETYPPPPYNPHYNHYNYGYLRPQYGHQRPIGPYGPLRPNIGYPQQNNGPFSFVPSRESFIEALDSIARNDELHCVPRILCEVTAGTLTSRQSGFKLPFNINMDSIASLLSGLNGMDSNPLLAFGRAALLGYSSKGNAGICMYAYPRCPRDPERLVEYLNNYNGGFFRFFNGLDQYGQQNYQGQFPGSPHNVPQHRPPFNYNNYPGDLYHPYRGYNYRVNKLEKRILTKPSEFDYNGNGFLDNNQLKGIRFPNNIDEYDNQLSPSHIRSHNGDSSRTLKFPISDEEGYERPFRKPKQLPHNYFITETDFQRPSPDHRPTPTIFPDRTGTGELKFTPEELGDNHRRPFTLQNNNLISFNSEANNPFYYKTPDRNSPQVNGYENTRHYNRFFPS